jgi:hypothetical protein
VRPRRCSNIIGANEEHGTVTNRTLNADVITPGLRIAIENAYRALQAHQREAITSRQHCCWTSAQEHSDAAQRYVTVLGRLEDLADSLGMMTACCSLGAQGEFCRCP